ncbi:hypothetical protein QJS10_CPA06g01220 [Acorus calamus]|uniref:Exo_endo_phos domain-containing protein n=1 Tax=Acorus calamus TaxID=4465 RepID=A0AAV9EML2_ACOCL|nr:hypothetical protein QJS10_CPA06g01220 [Acorus calamus]
MHFKVVQKSNQVPPLYVTTIYASNDPSAWLMLWNNLVRLSSTLPTVMWQVCGDFNEVRYAHEKVGGRPIYSRRVRKFNECLDKCGLEDLKAYGHTLSWNNQQSNRITCKLDRALAEERFVKNDYLFALQLEESFLQQKSHEHWLALDNTN